MLTADVFVNLPVKSIAQAYTYRVPEKLSFLGPGWRVFVPFGGRKLEGFVVSAGDRPPGERELKDIISAVDEEPWFTAEMMAAARWMADFYLCSLGEAMRLFMPGKSGLRILLRYEAEEGELDRAGELSEPDGIVYFHLLREGPKGNRELKRAFPEMAEEMEGILSRLLRKKMLRRIYEAQRRASAQYEQYALLQQPVTEGLLAGFRRKRAQLRLLELLAEAPPDGCRVKNLREQGVSSATVRALEAQGIIGLRSRRVFRDSYRELEATASSGIVLTQEQQRAARAITEGIRQKEYRGFLLHGVTGSGKTQVYIEAARAARELGRKVIVLVPEIALTGQLVMSFKAWFREDIIVMHSRLSLAERNDAVARIRREEAEIVIGARSALFVPARDAGLIILDEEQDPSYKQDESPRYHARAVAEQLARIHGAALVLGSATPSMESFYGASQGKLELLAMPRRVGRTPLPSVRCVDMRQELRQGNRHVLSRELKAMIERTLASGHQMILLLNRRGYSTFVLCRSCGEPLKCRFCGLPLVYHRDGRLLCHHCDVQEPVPDTCPKCGSRYIRYFGSGTEKLEQELKETVPAARVIRMDRDTTQRKFAHQEILAKFRSGDYDILMGTQMVAKGHDIPNVMAVGVISADSSLNMPDFRASERCFMLIVQAAGRAGRFHGLQGGTSEQERGQVVVQAYHPEHYAVSCGLRQDYRAFYEQELERRRQLFYPPFSRIVKLLFHGPEEERARAEAEKFVHAFGEAFPEDPRQQAIGPAPAMIANFRGSYRFLVLLKTAALGELQNFMRQMGLQLRTDVAIDIDPITMT